MSLVLAGGKAEKWSHCGVCEEFLHREERCTSCGENSRASLG